VTRITDELLALVACPSCKGQLVPSRGALACVACSLAYPVEDGVPVLLAERARPAEG
jgi:uncharacterized protein YbaR (Trm112 family)